MITSFLERIYDSGEKKHLKGVVTEKLDVEFAFQFTSYAKTKSAVDEVSPSILFKLDQYLAAWSNIFTSYEYVFNYSRFTHWF